MKFYRKWGFRLGKVFKYVFWANASWFIYHIYVIKKKSKD